MEEEQTKQQKMMQQVEEVDLAAMTLGDDKDLLGFQSRDQLGLLIGRMIEQGKHEVLYFGKRFDENVVGYSPVPDAIRQFLANNREAMLKTLVSDSRELVRSGSRLVELLRTNMPRVECRMRKMGNSSHANFDGSFILVDHHGYVYLPDADRFVGSACFNHAGTVDKLSEVFNENWRIADLDAEMQPLYI